jgi:DNA-binding LacI/PurR family transcriptional regulator
VATIIDVARLAGVGTTTVTKVLAGRPHVSPATRQRVLDAISALDYHPSRAGRMLRTGVTRVIGVITAPPATHPLSYTFFPALLEGIGDRAAASEYDVLWITSRATDGHDASYESLFKSQRIDGLINAWLWERDARVRQLFAAGYPLVVVGRPDDTSIPHVDAANREGGYQVGRAFALRGYDPVGFIGYADAPAAHDRLNGLRRALVEVGHGLQPEHVLLVARGKTGMWQEDLGHEVMRGWIEQGRVPRAVMTYTDQMSYGVMRACREQGLRVPEDVAVVGCDDEPSSRHLQPPLASLGQPSRELGYAAADMLISILSGSPAEVPLRLLPMRLIERASLGTAPHAADYPPQCGGEETRDGNIHPPLIAQGRAR